ncbi:aldehyde dehydrogenase family protein [Salinisphaera aquimarina]|uniref:Aldehyde dehydrogenase family protein n=1 Tax=Salinisphaera aquimarina TaxID=2094031 RepID=A0ABV7EM32_9GAMM
MQRMQMFVGGEWVDSSDGEVMTSIDPATREPLVEVPSGTAEDVDRAVTAARQAFESTAWTDMLPAERGRMLNRLALSIRENAEELSRLETLDAGKPLAQSRADVEVAARYCEYYAGVADKLLGETIPVRPDMLDYTLREPLGVTAHIVPWNYPLQIAMRGIAPALATGNAVVLKPADETPVTALKVAELIEKLDLSAGLVSIVTGTGARVGAALAGHPGVDHVTFTGSVPTGITVMQTAARNVTPVTLELGGKSPNIVFADADLEEAADWVVRAIIQNAGQTCSAGSRLLVERCIHEEFVARVVERMEGLTLGAGIDDPDVGPIVSQKQLDTIMAYMEIARNDGVTVRTGGKSPSSAALSKGFFFEPTVLDGLTSDHRLAREEIFGPVLSVIEFETTAQAVQIANDTEYGLITGVWTTNINKALWLADRIRVGQVYINNYGAGGGVELPFGGHGKSGFGREKGLEALRGYTQLKNVAVKIKPNA